MLSFYIKLNTQKSSQAVIQFTFCSFPKHFKTVIVKATKNKIILIAFKKSEIWQQI